MTQGANTMSHSFLADEELWSTTLRQAMDCEDWDGVLSASRSVLAMDPDHLVALEGKAQAHWRRHEFQAAIDTARKMIALNPVEPGYLCLQGACHQQLGRYVAAAECFGRALDLAKTPAMRKMVLAQIEGLEVLCGTRMVARDEDTPPVTALAAMGTMGPVSMRVN